MLGKPLMAHTLAQGAAIGQGHLHPRAALAIAKARQQVWVDSHILAVVGVAHVDVVHYLFEQALYVGGHLLGCFAATALVLFDGVLDVAVSVPAKVHCAFGRWRRWWWWRAVAAKQAIK